MNPVRPSPRYIFFRVQWQVLGPESPGQRFHRDKFQEFFGKLNEDRKYGGYDDFSYRRDICELAKNRGTVPKGGQAFSKVIYAKDSLSLIEEWTEYNIDEFEQKIGLTLDTWFTCFPETLAVAQNCWLRAFLPISNYSNSRSYLRDGVLGLRDAFESKVDSKPYKVGFTFGCKRVYQSTTMDLECKVSSWGDERSVWVEIRGGALLNPPLNAPKHEQGRDVFGHCRRFFEAEVVPLLGEYDKVGGESDAGGATGQ